MRLLEKTETNRLKALERKREVDEGMKLAHTVDNLRKVKSEEETNLRKFRDESLKIVKAEIDALIRDKNALNEQITALEAKRLEVQAPVDFTKELENLKKLKEDLLNRETKLISREIMVYDVDEKAKQVAQKEQEATQFLNESRKAYTEVDNLRDSVRQMKQEVEEVLQNRSNELTKQEESIFTREMTFKAQLEQLNKEKDDIRIQDTRLIERETKVESDNKLLSERQIQLSDKETLTKKYLNEASKNYSISEDTRIEVERLKNDAEHSIKERYEKLADREREIGYKERDIISERQNIENEKKEIEKEKLHIASQQETLRSAWVNIKKLK